jgi:hypothetical protein
MTLAYDERPVDATPYRCLQASTGRLLMLPMFVVPPAGFEPALPPPESGSPSTSDLHKQSRIRRLGHVLGRTPSFVTNLRGDPPVVSECLRLSPVDEADRGGGAGKLSWMVDGRPSTLARRKTDLAQIQRRSVSLDWLD